MVLPFLLALVTQSPAVPAVPDTARLRAVLDSIIPALMHEHDIPGVSLVVVRGDSTLALRGYGTANLSTRTPVDPERTVFRIASVAKLFVATAALGEVQRGRLELNADLRQLLPEIPIRGGDDAPLRLHDLLTHTAGFEERIIGMVSPTQTALRPLGAYLADRMPARDESPGVRTSYSNHGFALAGYAIERASGVAFADHAERELFAPLAMSRTAYITPPGDQADRAVGYVCTEVECAEALPAYTHTYPAGLAYSTAADMRQFLWAMLGRAGHGMTPVLDSAHLAQLQDLQFTHAPGLDGMAYGFWRHHARGTLLLSHAGNVPGFTALLQLAPARDIGFFLAANAGSGAFSRRAAEELQAALLPDPPPGSPPSANEGSDIAEFAGVYQLTRRTRRSIETFPMLFQNPLTVTHVADTLFLHRTTGPLAMIRTGPLAFESMDGANRVAFARDAHDQVAMLFAGQPAFGGEFPAAYTRLAWHDTPRFMNEYVSWLIGLPVLLLLGWLGLGIGSVIRRRLGWRPARPAIPAYAPVVAVAWSALLLVLGFGFIARSTRRLAGPMAYGLTLTEQVLVQLPWLLGAIAVVLVRLTWSGWRERWRWGGLVCLSGVTVSALATMIFLVRWGYLPATW